MSLFRRDFNSTFDYHNMQDEKCGNCKHHRRDPHEESVGWYCNNKRSDYYTDFTEYDDVCTDYESR